jgi:cell division protein FtsQ
MRSLGPLVADQPVRRRGDAPGRAAKPAAKQAKAPRPSAPVVRAQTRMGDRPRPPGPLARFWDRRLDRRDKVRLAAGGLTALVLVAAWAFGATAAIGAGASSAMRELAMATGLTVQKVTVVGRRDTPSDEVLAALGVRRGAPILDIDTEGARARLEQLGWVRTATVTRLLPDTLHVELVERSPLAVWQSGGKRMLVDRDGHVIEDRGVAEIAKLPLVVGEGAPAHAAEILATIALEPKLAERVVASVRVADRRWDVKLDNGVTVQLPETDYEAAWRRLAALDRAHGLIGRAIEAVDMRLADRLVVRMTDEAAKSRLGPAKNT